MASWDFRDDQGEDEETNNGQQPKGMKPYESYKDEWGNVWVYGRRGWRILGDYDG